MFRFRWAALLLPLVACTDPEVDFLPQPFSVGVTPQSSLISSATTDKIAEPFPVLIDTGTPLTAYDDHSTMTDAHVGSFTLYGDDLPRVRFSQVNLFVTPLASVGIGDATMPVSGVLGGDNLQRGALGLDYRGTPHLTFTSRVTPTTCELSTPDSCQAVFPFSLQGGQQMIQIGSDLYNYPGTRVVLDVCLEPLSDPVSEDLACGSNGTDFPPSRNRYLPTGVEVRMLVATGFPGLAVGRRAFERLRGAGAAAAAFDASSIALHLPDAEDAQNGLGIMVAQTMLGQVGVSPMAIVSHEGTLGPCGELARSRRFRRAPPDSGLERIGQEPNCPLERACGDRSNPPDDCDDKNADNAASVIELTQPIQTLVVDDVAPFLVGINADVRPSRTTIEGIIGAEVLRRLVSTIDYPGRRFIARCASDADCLSYRRFVDSSDFACDQSDIHQIPIDGGRCFAP